MPGPSPSASQASTSESTRTTAEGRASAALLSSSGPDFQVGTDHWQYRNVALPVPPFKFKLKLRCKCDSHGAVDLRQRLHALGASQLLVFRARSSC